MASSSGYGAEGAARSISHKLQAKDLPSKCLLGKGLASIVYETEWKGRRCARKDFIGVPSDIFEEEARVLVRLQHDNIAKTHGWTVDKMSCSLVVEYVEDDLLGLLQHRKKSQGSPAGIGLELGEALQVMSQTARAMEYLHGEGIIHGDLKTNNIFITQVNDGGKDLLLVKVTDFGLTQTKRKSIPFVSRPVRKLDMVQWKAPEYFKRSLSDVSEDNDESSESDSSNEVCTSGSLDLNNDRLRFQACDTYSFAMTCYQILTGKKPYPNWNWKMLGAKIMQEDLRPKLPASCPDLLRVLLVQCWDKDPMKRPTFNKISKALEAIQLIILKSIHHLDPITGDLDSFNIDAIVEQNPTTIAASFSKNFGLEIKNEFQDGHEKKKVEVNKSWSLHHFLSQFFCFGTSSGRGLMDKSEAEVNTKGQDELHWSELDDSEPYLEEEVLLDDSEPYLEEVLLDNQKVFESLQSHPDWGRFFQTFNYDSKWPMSGKLEVKEKFAENGQFEFFHTKVTWWDLEMNKQDHEKGREWVLKGFPKGYFLRDLQKMFPHGMLQFYANQTTKPFVSEEFPRYISMLHCGTLLKDGRFAFLMQWESSDLRSIIDRNMTTRSGIFSGPFTEDDVEEIMWDIALGMDWLHEHDIIHRDLKSSNVLVRVHGNHILRCVISGYECSVGMVGTGFFRAPEILQACKDRTIIQRPELFSEASDVYSYGMTCYEVVTGKLPFEDHALNDLVLTLNDLVLTGHRPLVPEYVDNWIHELLKRCWEKDPKDRPTFREILNIISINSKKVRKLEEGSTYQKKIEGSGPQGV